MSAVARTRQAAGEPPVKLLSIGQVLQRLSQEFPDLTDSKLRFLEDQGLVAPTRTSAGYRKYSPRDIERVQTTLTMQRDHYLPLKVIRQYLDDRDRGMQPDFPGTGAPATTGMLPSGRSFTLDEVARETEASLPLLKDAIAAGLLAPTAPYTDDDCTIARSLVDLRRVGISPRHLRGYRSAVQRDLGLIDSVIKGSVKPDATGRQRAQELALEMAQHLEVVRATIVRQEVRRGT